jgi:tetratricopeptide (TPR) repeat protein
MLKKMFLTIISFSFVFANSLNLNLIPSNTLNTTTSKENVGESIKTYKDYLKFKEEIEKMAVFEPARAYFILGTLYFKSFKFKNKTIEPDLNKALEYFYKSFKHGNKLSAYYIALIEYNKGNVYKALMVLDNALKDIKDYKNNIYSLLSIEYASIVLDTLRDDKDALNKAIKYIENVDISNDVAAYLYANLLYFSSAKNVDKASKVLNYVCTHTKNKEIKKMCDTNPYIKGNKVPVTCPMLKKFQGE